MKWAEDILKKMYEGLGYICSRSAYNWAIPSKKNLNIGIGYF